MLFSISCRLRLRIIKNPLPFRVSNAFPKRDDALFLQDTSITKDYYFSYDRVSMPPSHIIIFYAEQTLFVHIATIFMILIKNSENKLNFLCFLVSKTINFSYTRLRMISSRVRDTLIRSLLIERLLPKEVSLIIDYSKKTKYLQNTQIIDYLVFF